ncbi:plastocyanin/azurin family copper-binding protein [Nitrosopumilus sp. b3]|uniref:cupredoxin domain-containing protein n=1 Tax=Nitrosopumilus sp. b3 TaxID=2109909 RepID=UPI0015F4DBDC|nr:plastocyanin/azurin family copper-binding protein [Nitrosopumilus sp. b3]
MKALVFLIALIAFSSGYFINESFAEISENQAFLLEGSGFAVTEESIRTSEIDLGLSSQKQSGSTINFIIEDGFVTLDNEEFTISKLNGKFLREGQYVRINGNIESSNGFDTSISFFGRLVEESKDASVYGFTGRITTIDDSYKILYTTKLSKLSKISPVSTDTKQSENLTIHILKGSSGLKTTDDITPGVNSAINLRFFSNDRISVTPGATITIVNDDVVSHSILSGKENYGDRYNPFEPDGRISTGIIEPGESINITFENAGFYRLYDPNYTWMKIVAYVFPTSDNLVLGKGQNLGN